MLILRHKKLIALTLFSMCFAIAGIAAKASANEIQVLRDRQESGRLKHERQLYRMRRVFDPFRQARSGFEPSGGNQRTPYDPQAPRSLLQ